MAKLRDSTIVAEDLVEFVRNDSDFGFEMRVLAQLRTSGFHCIHGGTYRDPVTSKMRQFDIRAWMNRGEATLALAVECKNLRPTNPLLMSTVPRTPAESFHDVAIFRPGVMYPLLDVRTVAGPNSVYTIGEPVGKKSDQVGRDLSGGGE